MPRTLDYASPGVTRPKRPKRWMFALVEYALLTIVVLMTYAVLVLICYLGVYT